MKLEGQKGNYVPKKTDIVECGIHGIKTTWKKLNGIQKLAVKSNICTLDDLPCILLSEEERKNDPRR